MLKSFKDLLVWQEAINLVELIYANTKIFPKDEIYGLTSQIRRATVSIPANIAEGYSRKSKKEYLYFLSISNGSLAEVETYLIIAGRLNYLPIDICKEIETQRHKVWCMLTALRKSLDRV